MDHQWIIVYLLIAWMQISYQMSTPNSTSYIAAVMEFPPTPVPNDSESTLRINSDAFVGHIKRASKNNVDIIVFPEAVLTAFSLPERERLDDWTTIVPDASENYTPCIQSTVEISETVRKISCAAKENQIYVVINLPEKLPCTGNKCPEDKVFYYNTNVVFDRMGKIIAKYRKTNLFLEPQFNVTETPEIVTFDTDFGVKFGIFTCFDMLHYEPVLRLTRLYRITDFVFPTAWYSEIPFLTAIQVQLGWSFSEDVNLLASGANRPNRGAGGSGIYLGRKGIAKAIMPQHTHEEMLIYEVPKKKIKSDEHSAHSKDDDHDHKEYYHGKEHIHDELRKKEIIEDATEANSTLFLLRENIHAFQTVPLEKSTTETVCQNDFCCKFQVEITKIDPKTKYRLVTFSGIRHFISIARAVSECGIIQCSNDSISSCTSVQKSETVFNNIEITAKFDDYKNLLIMPSTLNSNLFPLENWTYSDHTHENHVHITISLNKDTNNLVSFGLFARDFSKNNAAVPFNAMNYVMILMAILLLSILQF